MRGKTSCLHGHGLLMHVFTLTRAGTTCLEGGVFIILCWPSRVADTVKFGAIVSISAGAYETSNYWGGGG